jgi:hypothetical protein
MPKKYLVEAKVSASGMQWIEVFDVAGGDVGVFESLEFHEASWLAGIKAVIAALRDGTVKRVTPEEYEASLPIERPWTHGYCIWKRLGDVPYSLSVYGPDYWPCLIASAWYRTEGELLRRLEDFAKALKSGDVGFLGLGDLGDFTDVRADSAGKGQGPDRKKPG